MYRLYRLPRSLVPRAWVAGAMLSAICAAPLRAQGSAAPTRAGAAAKITSVEGITEYALPNGLRVLLFPDVSKPTVTVNITYLVGSRLEGYGEAGMAHLLEHMAFKGTPRHRNIPQELTTHGSRPNGTTSYDRTNYFETVPATDVNLSWALDLEADRMTNSFIAKKDLESEFSVVRNEFESGENSPFRVLFERVMSTAYLWHGYGRATIGSKEDIESVPIDRLQAFYHRYYQPDNAVLVVAGKFDSTKVLAEIERRFGSIPKPARSIEHGNLLYKTYTIEPTQDGERSVTLRRTGDAPMIMAAYHVPSGSHSDYPAIEVLGQVLGDAPSGRLYKALVDGKLAASVSAFDLQLREPGMLFAMAQLRNGGPIDSARRVLEATLDQAAAAPVSAEEVARAKTALLKNIDLLLANSERVGFALTEWAAMGDWRLLFLYRDRLEKVTPADVQRAAAAYLKPANRTTGVFLPTDKPDRSTIPLIASVEPMVANYTGRAVVQAGEAFDVSPANIDARTSHVALSNGMQLTLLPKKTRGGKVFAQMVLRYGDVNTLSTRGAVSALTAAMLSRGTVALTRQQFKDSLDQLKARVTVGGGGNSVVANVETTRDKLPAVLALVASELRTPRFDSTEFEKLKQEQLATLEQAKGEPQAKAFIAIQQRMAPYPKGHPLHIPSSEEDIADVTATTVDQVRQFHRGFFGASNADLSVVGDVSGDSITTAARTLFGDWKSPQPFARLVRSTPAIDSTTVVIETPDKANAVLVAAQNLALRDDDPDYPAMSLANFMLGGGFLNSRLAVRLRQQEGISYFVGSQLQTASLDRASTLFQIAIFNPQNVDRLVTGMWDELNKVRTTGFSAAEVAAAKPGLLQQRLQSRANDPELVGTLVQRRFAARTMVYDSTYEAAVDALTVDQVNAAVKKYLDPAKISIVRAGDFKGKPPMKGTP
jgi:zinc protease